MCDLSVQNKILLCETNNLHILKCKDDYFRNYYLNNIGIEYYARQYLILLVTNNLYNLNQS